MIKVELHAHTDADPADRIAHGIRDLVDHAARLGYGALAVTLHDRYFDPATDVAYARERGVVLIAGIERTIQRRHILLVNFPEACARVARFRRSRSAEGGPSARAGGRAARFLSDAVARSVRG